MYGSNVDSEGKAIQGDSERIEGKAGIIEDVTLLGIELDTDNERASIVWKQPNGAKIKVTEFPSDDETYVDRTNARVKHVCTKVINEDDYVKAVEGSADFMDFMGKASAAIAPHLTGKLFRVKFGYNKKGYLTTALFPNYVEPMNTPTDLSRISINPKYDIFVKPTPSEEADELAPSSNGVGSNESWD